MNDIQKRIREIFDRVHVIQLATVRDGQPWCCNVHAVMDDEFNIYWVSRPDRRHSKEIADNPQVAVAAAAQLVKPLLGAQVEGSAKLVESQAQIEQIMNLYGEHNNSTREWLDDIISGNNPHKLYCLTPTKIAIFDQVNYPDDPQQMWEANKKTA